MKFALMKYTSITLETTGITAEGPQKLIYFC